MRQFDVFPAPRAAARGERPYVMVPQHARVPFLPSVVVAPLSRTASLRGDPRLTPAVIVLGAAFYLVTHELSAIDPRRLDGDALDNLEAHRFEITSALDHLFSAAG